MLAVRRGPLRGVNSTVLTTKSALTVQYCTLCGRIKAKKCAVYIDHKVVINCITVLYEPYSTVMRLIGHIQHCYALN